MAGKLIGARIDIETRSSVDIKHGPYKYFESPDAKTLIISYSPLREFAGGAVKMGAPRTLDVLDKASATKFAGLVLNPGFQKHAFNANFERIGLSHWLSMPAGTYLDPTNWHCSAIRANVNGIFGTLNDVAAAVRSPIQKDSEGKRLINLFSKPISSRVKTTCTCAQSGLTFHDPAAHAEDFEKFKRYCERDVLTEAGVANLMADVPDHVQAEYEMDQRINDRGFGHNKNIARAAVAQVQVEKDRLMGDLKVMTGLDNPNSVKQFREWLEEQQYPMVSLDKARRAEALVDPQIPKVVADALELKGAASLSSVTKHKAALDTRCADGRIRGALRFYGAHTGREAGRGIQPQNLPRYEAPRADRIALIQGTLPSSEAPRVAKGTVRPSIVPKRGHDFVTLDYNAIEARTLGWACGEEWVNNEFNTALGGQGKIYEATAAMMFGLDKNTLIFQLKQCDKCGKDGCWACGQRGKGKVSNLALGYAGGAGALVTMGAADAGIDIGNYKDLHAIWEAQGKPGKFHEWNRDAHNYPELLHLRDLYRESSPMTVSFWKQCAKAWDIACSGKGARFGADKVVTMMRDGKHNRLILPSGRSIWYRFARAIPSDTNPDRIDRRIFTGKAGGVGHVRTDTHGGKLTENINQALARDVLFDLMNRIEALGPKYPGKIVLHVHDEVVLEVPKKHSQQVFDDVKGMMGVPPTWAPGLAVQGAGEIMERYGK